jgi:hypothetical protein
VTECFDCMDPANYAAVALKLQQTALAAEACLFPVERSLRSAANLPTLIRTLAAPVACTANVMKVLDTFATLTFTNFTPSPTFGSTFSQLPAGVWQVGAFVNATATGTVDDNTYRQLSIVTRTLFSPTSVANTYTMLETQFEANVGIGVDLTLCTTVALNGNESIQFQFLHGNTSSTLNAATGSFFWAHRLSDEIALKVV